jgi:hypothetical protein
MHTTFCAICFSTQRLTRKSIGIAPIIVTDMRTPLGSVIGRMKVKAEHPEDDVIDNDLILVWGDQKTYHNRSQSFGTTLAWNRDARCRSELDHLERHSRHADH